MWLFYFGFLQNAEFELSELWMWSMNAPRCSRVWVTELLLHGSCSAPLFSTPLHSTPTHGTATGAEGGHTEAQCVTVCACLCAKGAQNGQKPARTELQNTVVVVQAVVVKVQKNSRSSELSVAACARPCAAAKLALHCSFLRRLHQNNHKTTKRGKKRNVTVKSVFTN